MKVPVPGVIASFSLEKITDLFDSGGSLGMFSKKEAGSSDTFIFGAGENHNLLRLEHNFNYTGESDKSLSIILEVVDPAQNFEARIIRNRFSEILPPEYRNEGYKAQLDNEREDNIAYMVEQWKIMEEDEKKNYPSATRDEYDARVAAEADAKAQEEVEEDLRGSEVEAEDTSEEEAAMSDIKSRPSFYIAYGVGDDLSSWCQPTLCVLLSADVKFDGKGARKLVMEFVASVAGFSRENELGKVIDFGIKREKIKTCAASIPFNHFDLMAAPTREDKNSWELSELLTEQGNLINPHPIIASLIQDYLYKITDCVDRKQVIVLLPNLGKTYIKKLNNHLTAQNKIGFPKPTFGPAAWTVDIVKSMSLLNAYYRFFTELGITCSKAVWRKPAPDLNNLDGLMFSDNYSGGTVYTQKVGGAAEGPAEHNILRTKDPLINKEVYRLLSSKKISTRGIRAKPGTQGWANELERRTSRAKEASKSADPNDFFQTSFQCTINANTLKEVSEKLVDLKDMLEKESKENLDLQLHFETDYRILKLWEERGIIKTRHSPALVFGAGNLISKVLHAGGWLADGSPASDHHKTILSEIMYEDDIDRFLNEEYNTAIWEASHFKSKSAGPFGGTNKLPDDMALGTDFDEDLMAEHQVPVFKLGAEDSNVLSMTADLKGFYTGALGAAYVTDQTNRAAYAPLAEEVSTGLLSKVNITDLLKFIHVDVAAGTLTGDDLLEAQKVFGAKFSLEEEEAKKTLNLLIVAYKNIAKTYPKTMIVLEEIDGLDPITHSNRIFKSMYKQSWIVSIKTLPMFHLSRGTNLLGKPALLFVKEPAGLPFAGISSDIPDTKSLYSGLYSIIGFKHTMSSSEVVSNFSLAKLSIPDLVAPLVNAPPDQQQNQTNAAIY